MSDFFRHLALKAKARTGFGPSLIGWLVLVVVSLILALVFSSVAAFVALASRFDSVIAGLILAGAFLLVAGLAALAAWITRRHNRARAERELAAQRRANLLDPAILSAALEIGRTLGWRRILTLAAAGMLAAGLGREWTARSEKPKKPEGE